MDKLTWGNWSLNERDCMLEYKDCKGDHYAVDLTECVSSPAVLNWIMQIAYKPISPQDIGHLVLAINDILRPQALLCGAHQERGPIEPRKVVDRMVQYKEWMTSEFPNWN